MSEGGERRLASPGDLASEVSGLRGWLACERSLRGDFRFADGRESLAFLQLLALLAQVYEVFPRILHQPASLEVEVTAGATGGLSERDFAFARAVAALLLPLP